MKKTALTVLAFAAMVLAARVSRAADIYDILPLDEYGMESYSRSDLPLHPADDPNKRLRPGDKFYFSFRFLAKFDEGSSSYLSGNWDFYSENTSWWLIGSTNLVYQPQIGVMVSRLGGTSQLRYADFEGTIPNGHYTDVIFSYTLQAGDFALPVVLAMEDASGKPVRASDDATCALSYFQNPYMKAHWKLRFPKPGETQPSNWYEADWSKIGTLPGPPTPVKEQWNDVSLKESGFYAKTVDFSSTWLTNRTDAAAAGAKAVWRQVHQGSTTAEGGVVELEADAAPSATVTLYAWSTNESAVVVAPASAVQSGVVNDTVYKQLGGLVVTMPDPNATGYPRPTKTYHVWPVVVNQGKTKSEAFPLYGVSQTANDGWSEVVLSPYTQFNLSDVVNDILPDYETVPVQCTEPLPPNVTITASADIVEVGPDQTTPAFELTVALSDSQFPGLSTKVIVTPRLRGTDWPAGADWRDYVHISDSKSQTTDWEYDGTVTNVFKRGQGLTKTVYVYALGADEKTAKLTGGLSFDVSVEPTTYFEKLGSATVHLVALAPVVTAGDKAVETIAGASRTFDLKVSDNYRNRTDTNTFYRVYFRQDDAAPQEIEAAAGYKWALATDGTVYQCDTNTMKLTKTPPSWRFPVTGKYAMKFFVEAPNGERSEITEDSTVTVTVKDAARVQAWFQMVVNGTNSWAETATYSEGLVDEDGGYNADGNPINVKMVLSTPNTSLNSVYAYLVPLDATTAACVSTNGYSCLTNVANATGLEILSGETESEPGSILITDGSSAGTTLKFEVVLTDNEKWGKGTVIETYKSKTGRIVSMNVRPQFSYVRMDGAAKIFTNGVPQEVSVGVSKRFTVHLTEIGKVDRSQMRIVWSIDEANGTHDGNDDTLPVPTWDIDARGDFTFTHLFRSKGLATVRIEYQDKDMGSTMKTFEFNVNVTDQPSLVLDTAGRELAEETDRGRPSDFPITLGFSDNGTSLPAQSVETITARVTVVAYDLTETDVKKTGFLSLGGADVTLKEGVTNEYLALFYSGREKVKLYVSKADGTQLSEYRGFTVSAEVLNATTNPVSNTPWKDYYLKTTVPVYVKNKAPSVKYVSPGDQSVSTNTIPTDIGKAMEIKVAFDDVPADLTNGYTVVLTGTELSESVTNHYDSSNYVYSVIWTQPGKKNVTMTVYDKDETPTTVLNWIYEVAPAKVLITMPHGPTDGIGSDYSVDYKQRAKGVGEGYLCAKDVAFAAARRHKMTWKCGEAAYSATVYASGYKTNAVDNGYLDRGRNDATIARCSYDIPIDRIGDNATEGGTGTLETHYTYAGYVDDDKRVQYDSFLYAWIVRTVGEGDTTETRTIAPEQTLLAMPNLVVSLPTEAAKGTTGSSKVYDETYVEGVFSREWHPGDNMGDINGDGVPDLYVTTLGLMGSGDGTSTTADDLADVNDNYVDVLPLGRFVPYCEWIGKGREELAELDDLTPFLPYRKIRGYGDGLNDATAAVLPNGDGTYVANPCAVVGVQPDRVYTNPKDDPYSTLSYVEWLAWSEFATAKWGADGVTNKAYSASWSPERPTLPTKADTDGDGIPDGYEYYWWYRAKVGWVENEGTDRECHRYLTGRRYDPRNPGEGTAISSAEILKAVDPLTSLGSKTTDTDNDGLPDILEIYYLETNPFDFDSDGDGLPDGWEMCYTTNLDPTEDRSLSDGMLDALRNDDGDAMAYAPVLNEANVLPKPRFIQRYNTFATIDKEGDTDGIQWYVEKPLDGGVSAFTFEAEESGAYVGTVFRAGGVTYVTTNRMFAVTAGGRLATALDGDTFAVTNFADVAATLGITNEVTATYLRLRPTRLEAGLAVTDVAEGATYALAKVVDVAAKGDCNAAWVYGNANVSAGKFGFLAFGRYALPEKGAVLAELPAKDRDVAFLHYLVYQQYGFDPRTAWNWNTPLASRWGTAGAADETYADQVGKLGYAGEPTRTRAYTAYDEFLVYSFFLNNGCDMGDSPVTSATATDVVNAWGAYTTNPQGPEEPAPRKGSRADVADVEYLARGTNGADTDGDGVPDGWELYVMSGPKTKEGAFVFAPPYAAFTTAGDDVIEMPSSYFSPFVVDDGNATDNAKYIGKDLNDGLTEYQEFCGTDSCAYYAEAQSGKTVAYSTTIKRDEAQAKWLNKFFPTDPWSADTDDDGVKDGAEGAAFVHAADDLKDDGATTCFVGGGLNPCSVDTDMDGLPDGWESQFAGSTVSTNAVEGLIDGMDGTVADAYTPVGGPNRDYDHDGLENWQEYMTGTMRCWRYDDPFTQWGSIPFASYYYIDKTYGMVTFEPDFKALGITGATETEKWNNFWYETLAHVGGPLYNPHLVTDQSPTAQFFTRVDVGWDPNYWDSVLSGGSYKAGKPIGGAYYWFAHRIGRKKYAEAWAGYYGDGNFKAALYTSCSPLSEDSDHDGMDDFYELFHGLNPLLGGDGVPAFEDPCDVVSAIEKLIAHGKASYNYNKWISARPARAACVNKDFDFVAHPWKNGLQTADPDGDDQRNYIESILSKFVSGTGLHTDPSPMWMTDASYPDSLTRLHYRMPWNYYDYCTSFGAGKAGALTVTDQNGDSVPGFTGPDGTKYYFRDFDAYDMKSEGEAVESFTCDRWGVYWAPVDARTREYENSGDHAYLGSWMFSFEENEGYDTDHDFVNDTEEVAGRVSGATDPLDADSPRRRQAMYFPGVNAALQTPPELIEDHPVAGHYYRQEPSFSQYTVECWAMPEEVRDATVVERAIWTAGSAGGDRELVRKNFQIATRVGSDGQCYWFTKFDSNGTGSEQKSEVTVQSGTPVAIGEWSHVAATYDGKHIVLYVNGQPNGMSSDETSATLQPECGVSSLVLSRRGTSRPVETNDVGEVVASSSAWLETLDRYSHHAILVGASVRSYVDFPGVAFAGQWSGYALNLYNALGWMYYKDFFKGYVDEVRIWDGARSLTQIQEAMSVRFDAEKAKENRNEIYDAWKTGASRYLKDDDGTDGTLTAELRYHFAFDSLPSADSAAALATVPLGFANGEKAPLSRPDGYVVNWWKRIVEGYGSAYAGATNYVTWIPNTVAHLPRFDGTTLDSAFWSDSFEGDKAKTCSFAHTAEPYSLWSQLYFGIKAGEAESTLSRWYLAYVAYPEKDYKRLFAFTGRNLLCEGADLLPLGGAFARYVDKMWDGQGAAATHELTGVTGDADSDGLPNWWERYAEENYRGSLPTGAKIGWSTIVDYHGRAVTAGEAYLRDLAKGAYCNAYDTMVVPGDDAKYRQTSDQNNDGIPDWWANLYRIADETGVDDHDNDGLDNYAEYLVSEKLPFGMLLNPCLARTDGKTLDYFRTFGKLYLGEMLTDHDLMEDHWERSLGDARIASAALWDATKDGDEDGWDNFAENRYNGFAKSILAQYASHAVGDAEVLDAPVPSVKLVVRYNGTHYKKDTDDGEDPGDDGSGDVDVGRSYVANLIVRTFTKPSPEACDAEFRLKPGETVTKAVYIGGWENRVVTGTMAPGNIDIGSVDIRFAQVPQKDLYSWTDESGLHTSRSYEEYKEALKRNPDIIQNIQDFEWLQLAAPANEYVASDRAVTVARDAQSQTGIIAVYGERVGTVDLTTGDFTFDLGAMMTLSPNYTFKSTVNEAWSYKEAIFKITYSATIPSVQPQKFQVTLANADTGFIRGGKNTIMAFFDTDDSGDYTPGEPFGVLNGIDIGWAGRTVELELTDMSAVTPRVDFWQNTSDRATHVAGANDTGVSAITTRSVETYVTNGVTYLREVTKTSSNGVAGVTAPAPETTVRLTRFYVDGYNIGRIGLYGKNNQVLERKFDNVTRSFLHEGDFLGEGEFDIDWANLYKEVVDWSGAQKAGCKVTNITYIATFDWNTPTYVDARDTNVTVQALSTLITRRFEKTRSVPTPCMTPVTVTTARPTFAWKVVGEDPWASEFGTTYTAFKIRIRNAGTGALVYDSGVTRLPPKRWDINENSYVYEWTAPVCVGSLTQQGVMFENLANYTWEVALYNAKFSTDDFYDMDRALDETKVFSTPQAFRMNVTDLDLSSYEINVRACYAGPAAMLTGRIRVQAFETPDFTGDPVAEVTLADTGTGALSPATSSANARLYGLSEGGYYIRAYIDTNGNGVRDAWESWGYLNERDRANVTGIFNPVEAVARRKPSTTSARLVLIEDCDTDGDGYPDVWEAEQNGGEFDKDLIGPASGDAELIAVNPNLKAVLSQSEFPALTALATANGFAMASGIAPSRVAMTTLANGSTGFTVDNKVESVQIGTLAFDANGDVVISVEGSTVADSATELSSFYSVVSAATKTVTCRVYAKADLASDWGAPVAEDKVTVGAGAATLTVDKEKVSGTSAFFKVEVDE